MLPCPERKAMFKRKEEHYRILPKETYHITRRLTVSNQPTHADWNWLLPCGAASTFFFWRAALYS
jgi:hypothetical protein